MTYEKTIVVLAKSRKFAGSCVAGKVVPVSGGVEWVRPVSARPAGELNSQEMRYSNFRAPSLLDVVAIQLKGKRQHEYQPENHIIDDVLYWKYLRRMSWVEASALSESFDGSIWEIGHSTRYGLNDKIPISNAPGLGESLALIKVGDLNISVELEWPDFGGKRKVRGSFTHSGVSYKFAISDPLIEGYYLRKPDGLYPLGRALLCISLAEPYKEDAYKLIAGVILPS